MSKLKVYQASAGSGKTFQLTVEYLKIILKNPFSYKNILAVTFTNKATAEMKSRIISVLYKLSQNNADDYKEVLIKIEGITPENIKNQAEKALKLILHDYSRFYISTIDSFFQQIIRAFSKETGLDAGFNLEMDTKKVLSETVTRMFVGLSGNESLLNWLVEYSFHKITEGSSWNLKNDIEKFAYEIIKESYIYYENELKEKIQYKEFMSQYIQSLHSIINGFEKQMKDYGNKGMDLIKEHNLSIDDFSNKKSGPAGYFLKITKANADYDPKVRAREACESPEKWYAKKSDKIPEITTCLNQGLLKFMNDAVNYYSKQVKYYNSALVILKKLHVLGVVNDITETLRDYRTEKNLLLISDTARFLSAVINENDAPYIYEKAGNRFRHYMIDEFQDTSHLQWHNLKPLLENSLSEGNTSLVVGDIKQSIYRWRNSDWKLLADGVFEDFKNLGTQTFKLENNWRSQANIVAFNNSVFNTASNLLKDKLDDFLKDKNKDQQNFSWLLDKAYLDINQKLPANKNKNEGYVKHTFIENSDKQERTNAVLTSLKTDIEKLQDNGYKAKDIAILVRKKDEGKLLADYLMNLNNSKSEEQNYNYSVISNEALVISGSESIQLLISCLWYLHNHQDTTNMAMLYQLYTNFKHPEEQAKFHYQEEMEQLVKEILPDKETLKLYPVYEICEELIDRLELHENSENHTYLTGFLNLVADYENKERSDINDFLEWWDDKGKDVSLSANEEQNSINIYTIHKSKGLEFKAVLIPFCDWKLDHEKAPIIWCNSEAPFHKLSPIPVSYQEKLSESVFAEAYYLEKTQIYVDNLNLLYVGFTRAQNCLICYSEYIKRDSYSTIGDVMYHIYSSGIHADLNFRQYWNSETKCFEYGNLQTINSKNKAQEAKPLSYIGNSYRKSFRLKQSSENYFQEEQTTENINYGKLMHKIFECIITIKDVKKAVSLVFEEGIINSEEKEMLQLKVEKYLEHEEAQKWFDKSMEVINENNLLMPDGKILRPDRICLTSNQTIVIDYKFTEDETKSHQKQVLNYMNVLQEMGYNNVSGYVWYPEKEIVTAVV